MKANQIKFLVAKGNTKGAILLALEIFSDFNNVYNKFIVLSAEYERWESDGHLGLNNDQSIINRINLAVVTLVDNSVIFLNKAEIPNSNSTLESDEVDAIAIPKDKELGRKRKLLQAMIESEEMRNQPHPIVRMVQNRIIRNEFKDSHTISMLMKESINTFYEDEIIEASISNIRDIFLNFGKGLESPTSMYFFNRTELRLDNDLLIMSCQSTLHKIIVEPKRFDIADEICKRTRKYFKMSTIIEGEM